jgi:putative Mn2+ efflux pump MntP
LIGVAIGAPVAHAIGDTAEYVAAAAVIAIGAWMLLHGDDEEEKAGQLISAHGVTLLGLGVSVSLDELAIGFSLGLTHLPLIPVGTGDELGAIVRIEFGHDPGDMSLHGQRVRCGWPAMS